MSPDERLARCLTDPGYTPARAELEILLANAANVGSDDLPKLLRVLARGGEAALEAALKVLASTREDATRHAAYGLLGRLVTAVSDERFLGALTSGLGEPSPRSRRAAASALGKLGDARAEAALLAALEGASLDVARVVVEALGKLGGGASQAALDRLQSSDPELRRRTEQARLLLQRRLARHVRAGLALERALPGPRRVRLLCRAGLASILAEELAPSAPRKLSDSAVELEHAGTLAALLSVRTALEFALVVPLAAGATPRAQRIAAALAEPNTAAALHAWTDGPPRLRIEWAGGGQRRAESWELARELAAHSPGITSDPRAADWVLRVAERELLLLPRLRQDPRFTYREHDVPAASHPTLAAALARVLTPRSDDVVWDPFVGSGLELIERARLGPYARLVGTDIEPAALAAARANAANAGVARLSLLEANALRFRPDGVTRILTNPPMGRRVARDGSLGALLRDFVAHAAEVLPAGGQLVWLSPLAKQTAEAAARAGLSVRSAAEVDMGGFSAELQILTR